MRRFLLVSLLFFCIPSHAALEEVIPGPTFTRDDSNTHMYLYQNFGKLGPEVYQMCKHLLLGQRQQLNSLLDQQGDLSHLAQDDLKKLLSRTESNREYALARRLLIYQRLHKNS